MSKKLILLVGGGPSYTRPTAHLGLQWTDDPSRMSEVSLAIFTGGEDVGPKLYKHPKDSTTSYNSKRDDYEVSVFKQIPATTAKLGICRGAQFLCVMAGGSLVQDCTRHTQEHVLEYLDPEHLDGIQGKAGKGNFDYTKSTMTPPIVKTSPSKVFSTHHQMQYPWDLKKDEYKLIAWSPYPISDYYAWNGQRYGRHSHADMSLEPDIVYYPKINALAIQYHPEWMGEQSWGFGYARHLVSRLMGGKL